MAALAAFVLVAGPSAMAQAKTSSQATSRIGDVVAGSSRSQTVSVIVSLSCVFCRSLDQRMTATKINALVGRGYAVEFVPVVASDVDEVPTAILRCGGTKGYIQRLRRLYNSSSIYAGKGRSEAEAMAKSRAADYGLTAKQMNDCLTAANYLRNTQLTRAAKQKFNYTGTPSIYINGRFAGHGIADLPRG